MLHFVELRCKTTGKGSETQLEGDYKKIRKLLEKGKMDKGLWAIQI
jgi:hypothetical protein